MKRIVAPLCLALFTWCSAHAQTLTAPATVKMGAKIQVTLAGTTIPEEHEETMPALLDTGSDITAVPGKLR